MAVSLRRLSAGQPWNTSCRLLRIRRGRELSTGVEQGIAAEDLAQAVHQQLCDTAQLLTPRNIKDYVSSIAQDARVVAVTTDLRPQDGPGYLRS